MNKLIVAVEGVSFSGKTTLCARAKQGGFDVIPEPSHYARGAFRQARSAEDARFNALKTLEIERERSRDAKALKGEILLLDRSVFSLCALSYAYKTALGWDFFQEILLEAQNALVRGEILCPTFFLHLTAELGLLRARQKERGAHFMPYWLSEDFIGAQQSFYQKIITHYKRQGLFITASQDKFPFDGLTIAPHEKITGADVAEWLGL